MKELFKSNESVNLQTQQNQVNTQNHIALMNMLVSPKGGFDAENNEMSNNQGQLDKFGEL
jgi:hypothetical protein